MAECEELLSVRCSAGGSDDCTTVGFPQRGATAPFQYALFIRAGCECVAHAVQAMIDVQSHHPLH